MAARFDFRLSKQSDVSIHEQLTGEITYLIATGQLKPGEALPSVRALARQLEIHHNTVSQAYIELEARNLLLRRRGRSMTVRAPGDTTITPSSQDLDDLINAAIRAAQASGFSIQQLRQRVRQRLTAVPPDHFLVVSSDRGIRHLLQEELKEGLRFPVETCSPDELASRRELAMGALVVGPTAVIPKLSSVLPKGQTAVPITVSSASEELEIVRQLAKPSTIALVSISELVLRTARAVFAPVVGERHALQEYFLPRRPPGSLAAADLVLCDRIAARRVKARNKVTFRLISPPCLENLASVIEESETREKP